MTQNNHYIPQFIMRRYGDKINRYNVKNGRYVVKGSKLNAFVEKGLYPNELEVKLSRLESEFANLIDKKILNANEQVVLTRDELWLIKKFFTIALLRVPSSLNGPRNLDTKKQNEEMGFKEIIFPNEKDIEYKFRTINVILESNNIEDIHNSPKVTFEACKWSSLFNSCYLSIWDSKESNEDFIITDNGMNCEHDKSRFTTFLNLCGKGPYENKIDEMIKRGYLYSKLNDALQSKDERKMYSYFQIEERMKYVHANYYLFAVSNNRTISLINPFFRMYFDETFINQTKEIPKVWPSKISQEALKANKNIYVKANEFHLDDKYIYEIKSLKIEDVILINCLMLDRVDTWFGFDETSKILRSLSVYNLTEYQRNNFKDLISLITNNGYELYKTKKYKDLAKYMTNPAFTNEEIKYIEYFYNLILNHK